MSDVFVLDSESVIGSFPFFGYFSLRCQRLDFFHEPKLLNQV